MGKLFGSKYVIYWHSVESKQSCLHSVTVFIPPNESIRLSSEASQAVLLLAQVTGDTSLFRLVTIEADSCEAVEAGERPKIMKASKTFSFILSNNFLTQVLLHSLVSETQSEQE